MKNLNIFKVSTVLISIVFLFLFYSYIEVCKDEALNGRYQFKEKSNYIIDTRTGRVYGNEGVQIGNELPR